MSEYARETKISVTQSMNEIQDILSKHGITRFMIELEQNAIYFQLHDKPVKLSVPKPRLESFRYTPTGQRRSDAQTQTIIEQQNKARWRLMKEYLKLQLELVKLQVLDIEQAFMANFVLLNGKTLGETWTPELKNVTADMLKLPEPGQRT